MRGRRSRGRLTLAGFSLALCLSFAPEAAAHHRATIVVGEIDARVAGADAGTREALRVLVSREIERLRLEQATRGEAYVFSAALVRFEARASRGGAHAACVVSGVLRRAGTGAIVAMMQGRGSADDATPALQSVKTEALAAAVRGAVRHLPEAI